MPDKPHNRIFTKGSNLETDEQIDDFVAVLAEQFSDSMGKPPGPAPVQGGERPVPVLHKVPKGKRVPRTPLQEAKAKREASARVSAKLILAAMKEDRLKAQQNNSQVSST